MLNTEEWIPVLEFQATEGDNFMQAESGHGSRHYSPPLYTKQRCGVAG